MPRAPLDAESLRRLGGLSRLAIPEEAIAGLAADLWRILEDVEQLSPIHAAGVGADLAQIPPAATPRRTDVPCPVDGAALLGASAGREGRFVRVPPNTFRSGQAEPMTAWVDGPTESGAGTDNHPPLRTSAWEMAAAVHNGADPSTWARAAAKIIASNPHNAFRPFDRQAVERDIGGVKLRGRLAGVPIVVKDNLADAGQPCGCGSRVLDGYRAPYSAHCLDLLRAEGAIIVGRTNMDEFAMGSSTEHSAFGPVAHPLNAALSPGGSSGGSAAAVAAGIVPIALGSDTGGSVRQPAAFCGIVGIKPTYGRVSRRGLVAFASSLDTIAPFAANIRDAALVCEVLCGHDAGDATSLDRRAEDWRGACDRGVHGLTIGVLDEFPGVDVSPGIATQIQRAHAALSAQGATVVRVSIPVIVQSLAAYHVIAAAEAASNLARFDGVRFGHRSGEQGAQAEAPGKGTVRSPNGHTRKAVYAHRRREGFGIEVQRRILLGTHVLSAGSTSHLYARALATRALLISSFEAIFQRVDVLLTPTTPTVAFGLGQYGGDPLAMYQADRYTVPASLAGLPAISVPFGAVGGLPVGIQLTANRYDEATLFAAAAAVAAAA